MSSLGKDNAQRNHNCNNDTNDDSKDNEMEPPFGNAP
jgi:hypothetical protein